jgi:hypothetical protein
LIQLVVVPPSTVEKIWPRLDEAYAEACKHSRGTMTKEVVKARAMAGGCTLWIAAEDRDTEVTATCITSYVAFPGGLRALFVELIGGSVQFDIFDFRATLEKQAKADGCHQVIFLLPRKWASKVPDYKISHCLLCKELA